jgi:hypothetical protein
MTQSHIVLTQAFVNELTLSQIIASSFFANQLILPATFEYDIEQLKANWEQKLATNQILEANFKDKDDFKDSVMEYYQSYEKPTLLFLGNLSQYSLPLQEGMLRLLEEPPENLFIVLYAHTKSEILPTIISRSRILNLPRQFITKILDQAMVEKVKKKLPPVGEFAKGLLSSNDFNLPDLSKVEREELDFWYWQLSFYLDQYYQLKPSLKIAQNIQKVLEAQRLNMDNLQKKFAFAWIKTI